MMKQNYLVKHLFIQEKGWKEWKNWKKVKKEREDGIQILGQTPMHLRKRLGMANKTLKIAKEQKQEDEAEITKEVNNKNKSKQADEILKYNIKKKFQKIIFIVQKKKKKHLIN